MNRISETNAIKKLAAIREGFRDAVAVYEQRAESCVTCTTQGACCLDAHFVNVRVTRLETQGMRRAIDGLPLALQAKVSERITNTIETYKLDEALDTAMATYACPLFEKGIGCLVHHTAKPLPCIAHACYNREADLPPDDLLDVAEEEVERLNRQAYGSNIELLSIPISLR